MPLGEPFECDTAEGLGSTVRGAYYGSQEAHDEIAFPEGTSLAVDGDVVVMSEYHVINPSAEPSPSEVWVNAWYPEPGASITTEAGTLLFFHDDILIPPHGSETARMKCQVPADIRLAFLIPHMHARGRGFRAWAEAPNETIPLVDEGGALETAHYDPPVALPAGSTIRFECDFDNPGASLVEDGFSAIDDEMCVLFAGYFGEAGPRLPLLDELCRGEGSGIAYAGTQSCSELYDCDNDTWWSFADPESDAALVARHVCHQSACEAAYEAWRALTSCIDTHCVDTCWAGMQCATKDCPECLACIAGSCSDESTSCEAATCSG